MYRGGNEESPGITSLIEWFRLQVRERSRFSLQVCKSFENIQKTAQIATKSARKMGVCECEGARRSHDGFPVIQQHKRLLRSKFFAKNIEQRSRQN